MDLQAIINLLKDTGNDCGNPIDTNNLAELIMERVTSENPTEDELLDILYQIDEDTRNSL